jgi:hypothetical protein
VEKGLYNLPAWVQSPDLAVIGYVVLGKFLNLSELQFRAMVGICPGLYEGDCCYYVITNLGLLVGLGAVSLYRSVRFL